MTRVLILLGLCAAMLTITLQAWGANEAPRGLMVKNTTLVPLRYVAEWLGATVEFDAPSQRITMHVRATEIQLTLNSSKAMIDDKEYRLTVSAMERNGVTYVPLRFVAEGFGALVAWDNQAQVATITHQARAETLRIAVGKKAKQPVTKEKTVSSHEDSAHTPAQSNVKARSVKIVGDWADTTFLMGGMMMKMDGSEVQAMSPCVVVFRGYGDTDIKIIKSQKLKIGGAYLKVGNNKYQLLQQVNLKLSNSEIARLFGVEVAPKEGHRIFGGEDVP